MTRRGPRSHVCVALVFAIPLHAARRAMAAACRCPRGPQPIFLPLQRIQIPSPTTCALYWGNPFPSPHIRLTKEKEETDKHPQTEPPLTTEPLLHPLRTRLNYPLGLRLAPHFPWAAGSQVVTWWDRCAAHATAPLAPATPGHLLLLLLTPVKTAHSKPVQW